ncbi:carbohydrate kinase [Alphaproteobacteria bacterium]|jgi:fructokinase|nr:carbohydrate kinase [Alphaproteobacteria bacterium]
MILAAGEALIDLVLQKPYEAEHYAAKVGGAPLNAALALGRLDVPVKFACPVSTDHFGDMIIDKLSNSKVALAAPDRVSAPSPLAVVTLDAAGVPSYNFYREGTADRQIDGNFIAQCLHTDFDLLHIGGTALADADDFNQWIKLIKATKDRGKLVSIDPNIRPTLITDMKDYTSRLANAFAYADIIKASDEDCSLLFGHADIELLRADHFTAAALIVITQGSKGVMAQMATGQPLHMHVERLSNIRDTVGAGDCFQAGMLSQLWQNGYLESATKLTALDAEKLTHALAFAHKVASINCQRDGCNPPFLDEIPNS